MFQKNDAHIFVAAGLFNSLEWFQHFHGPTMNYYDLNIFMILFIVRVTLIYLLFHLSDRKTILVIDIHLSSS
jgi:hypothetical protein